MYVYVYQIMLCNQIYTLTFVNYSSVKLEKKKKAGKKGKGDEDDGEELRKASETS